MTLLQSYTKYFSFLRAQNYVQENKQNSVNLQEVQIMQLGENSKMISKGLRYQKKCEDTDAAENIYYTYMHVNSKLKGVQWVVCRMYNVYCVRCVGKISTEENPRL